MPKYIIVAQLEGIPNPRVIIFEPKIPIRKLQAHLFNIGVSFTFTEYHEGTEFRDVNYPIGKDEPQI